MKKSVMKVISMFLCCVMLLGIAPGAVIAADDSAHSLTVASRSSARLAPGVTETTVVSYDKNGDRVKYWVVKAEVSKYDTVQIKANYHDNDNTGVWGKATVVEQANAATEKRGYNVVASQNAAYYNVTTGQPTGAFVMEGVNINGDDMGNATEFFAQMDDGTYMIGKRGTFKDYSKHIVEAIGGYRLLVWDGKVVSGLDATSKYPRSTIGVTAEGDVITMMADGNQKPASAGLTYAEQAQLMAELGCVAAVELDGGGSATYASKYEGEDEITVRNNCCDGTVRSVSNTFMIISTAVADGTFDHANLSTEYAYYAAHSDVIISSSGADASGHAAEIPEGVSWALSDDTFGTVNDGVFSSNGKLGTVAVNMVNDGKTIGTVNVTVVDPTSVEFSGEKKTIPYGKLADMTVTAMFNGAEMYVFSDAFDFKLSNSSAGTMDGFNFTATSDESIKTAELTATYKYAEGLEAKCTVSFGKGSEILFDFEDYGNGEREFDWGTWYDLDKAAKAGKYDGGYITQYEPGQQSSNQIIEGIRENVALADAHNGKVHSGDYALAYTYDYRQQVDYCDWLYGYLYYWGEPITLLDTSKGINGVRLGMWMYIPEEAVGSCSRLAYTYKQDDGSINTAYLYFTYQYVEKGFSKLTSDKIPEAGWAYVSVDMSQISKSFVSTAYFYNEDGSITRNAAGKTAAENLAANYAPAFIQWIISSSSTGAEKCTFYIDDITLDYSDAVDDRDAPKIGNITYADSSMSDAVVLNNQTTGESRIDFAATVEEDMAHNFTSVDASTAAVYIDGQKVSSKYTATTPYKGLFAASVELPNGTHDVTFEIADMQGNFVKTTKQITVNAPDSPYPAVYVFGEKMNKNAKIKCGEQYNINITTDKAEAIDTLTATIWLNSASTWALEHMTAAQGFEVKYTLDEVACKATVTVENTGSTLIGDAVLVSIPVYNFFYDGSSGYDAHTQWVSKGTAPILTLSWDVQFGKVTYTEGNEVSTANYVAGFGKERVDEKTELDASIANLKSTIGEWHYHSAEAVADKESSCTESGYTGRTVCKGCNSIIEWGTVLPAEGHSFEVTDGVLRCHCGEIFNGVYTDGKTYINGVPVGDGWKDDSYFRDSRKLTGVQLVEGFYYDFGENGICENRVKYSGLLTIDGKLFCAVLGELVSGWQEPGDETEWYYFEPNTKAALPDGQHTINGITYTFTDGHTKGAWVHDSNGFRYYYCNAYYKARQSGVVNFVEIDGKTYGFQNTGYRFEGINRMGESAWGELKFYEFDDEGVLVGPCNGIVWVKNLNSYYYCENALGVQKDLFIYDGDYCFSKADGKIVTGVFYVSEARTNGLLPCGYYQFDETGRKTDFTGFIDGIYYAGGMRTANANLVKVNDDYYFIDSQAKAKKGHIYLSASKTNGIVPAGYYDFDEETGAMLKSGIFGNTYYVNGVPTEAGFVSAGGDYFYAGENGILLTGKVNKDVLTKLNGHSIAMDEICFDENGKLLLNGIFDGYYYVNGVKTKSRLIECDGGLYFPSSSDGKAKTGVVWVSASNTNGIVPAAYYHFDETGRKTDFTGFIDGIYFVDGTRTASANLVKLGDDYYYIDSQAKAKKGHIYLSASKTNGLVPVDYYDFDEETGKMVKSGIFGNTYYVNGVPTEAGLVSAGGDYFYAGENGILLTGKVNKEALTKLNGHNIAMDEICFDESGKLLLNGIFDGYYYVNGVKTKSGLIECDGGIYFPSSSSGKVKTGVVWVSASNTNGIAPAAYYHFDETGRKTDFTGFIDGIYFKDGVRTASANLVKVGNDYFFIDSQAKAKTGHIYLSASKTNGLVPVGYYDFDAQTGIMK